MTKNWEEYTRFVKSNFVPLILWIVFLAVFYAIYFGLWTKLSPDITSGWIIDFAKKFWVFDPIAYWILSIIILYIFYFIKWVVRLNFCAVNLILIRIVYGFSLYLWIHLLYIEPRNTDVARYIIDAFSKPMIWASAWVLLLSIVFIFIKKKKI
jgi:hypothetical protein